MREYPLYTELVDIMISANLVCKYGQDGFKKSWAVTAENDGVFSFLQSQFSRVSPKIKLTNDPEKTSIYSAIRELADEYFSKTRKKGIIQGQTGSYKADRINEEFAHNDAYNVEMWNRLEPIVESLLEHLDKDGRADGYDLMRHYFETAQNAFNAHKAKQAALEPESPDAPV